MEYPESIHMLVATEVTQVGALWHAVFQLPLYIDGKLKQIVVSGVDDIIKATLRDAPVKEEE